MQHEGKVVCPEVLNGELEALQLTFPELPLWDIATPSGPFQEPQLLEVDLHSVQPEGMTTTIQAPTITPVLTYSPADTIEPPCYIAMAINLHLYGALEQLQQASSAALVPVSQHSMPRREPPSVALGALPLGNGTEDPLRLMGTESSITQMPPWVATPGDAANFTHTSLQLLQPTLPQLLEVVCISFISQPQATPRVGPARLTHELLQPQERMNAALEQLLSTRTTMDSHHKELELKTKFMA